MTITSKFHTLFSLSPTLSTNIYTKNTYKRGMDKKSKTSEEECVNETRQYRCLRKYEKIVNQFDELMQMVDSVTQSRKRRRVSNSQRKQSTSDAVAVNSAPTAGEGDSSTMSSASQAEKTAALEQIITKHLNDLQSDRPLDLDSNKSGL